MKKVEKLVQEFIYDQIPAGLLKTFAALAELQYPIDDLKSMEKVLHANNDNDNEAARAIMLLLDVDAFPLASPQNALEKLYHRLPEEMHIVPIHHHTHVTVIPGLADRIRPELFLPWWVRELLADWYRRIECLQEAEREHRRCMENASFIDQQIRLYFGISRTSR